MDEMRSCVSRAKSFDEMKTCHPQRKQKSQGEELLKRRCALQEVIKLWPNLINEQFCSFLILLP